MLASRRTPQRLKLVRDTAVTASTKTGHACIAISIAWGETTLHVDHLRAGMRFVVGDAIEHGVRGFVVPNRPPSNLVDVRDGKQVVVIPECSNATFVVDDRSYHRRHALRANVVRRDPTGSLVFPLEIGSRCRLSIGALTIEIAAVIDANVEHLRPPALLPRHWIALAVSLLLHVALLIAIFTNPSSF